MDELPLAPLADLQRRVQAIEQAHDADVKLLVQAIDNLSDHVSQLLSLLRDKDVA